MRNLLQLPIEILINILEYLQEQDLLNVALVNRALCRVAFDDCVWRSLCARRYRCCQHTSGKLQIEASQIILLQEHIPPPLRIRLSEQAIRVVAESGQIFRSMKEHFQYVKRADQARSFLQRSVFQAALDQTFSYLVHSDQDWVGRELIAALEHCNCEWGSDLIERVLGHSRIPPYWKAILICKLFWTVYFPFASKRMEFDEQIRYMDLLLRTDGKLKLSFLLEKAIHQHWWSATSELIVDILLLLGAIPSCTALKRALVARCDGPEAVNNLKTIFPKIALAMYYTDPLSNASFNNMDGMLPLSSALERYEIEHGPEGDILNPIHVAALYHNIDMLEYLVQECGIDINQETTSGNTALSLVFNPQVRAQDRYLCAPRASEFTLSIAQKCLDMGAQATALALRAAMQSQHWDFAKLMVDRYNADPCMYFLDASDQVQTLLQLAFDANRLDLAMDFLMKGSELLRVMNFDWLDDPRCFDFLLATRERLVDWNELVDSNGDTIAHALAMRLNASTDIRVVQLATQMVSPLRANLAGNTPMQVVIESMNVHTPLGHMLVYFLQDSQPLMQLFSNFLALELPSEQTLAKLLQDQIQSGEFPSFDMVHLYTNSGISLLDQAIFLDRADLVALILQTGGQEIQQRFPSLQNILCKNTGEVGTVGSRESLDD